MDSTATSGGQPWAGGDEWEEVCPPASTRLVGGRRKQTNKTNPSNPRWGSHTYLKTQRTSQ